MDSKKTVKKHEIWKPTVGFIGYEVSNYGKVRSYWELGTHLLQSQVQRELKPCNLHGYPTVSLQMNKRGRTVAVHILVLEAFVGPRPYGYHACHNDGDKLNNNTTNLRWGTRSDNECDKVIHGRSNRGERQGRSKLKTADVIKIRSVAVKGNYKELADKLGVSSSLISYIVNRKCWRHI